MPFPLWHRRPAQTGESLAGQLRAAADAPKRILLVEDNAELRGALAAAIVQRHRAEVLQASTMTEGIDLCRLCDVAILDIRLPDGDGIEIYRRLVETKPMTEVVFLTSFSHLERYREEIEGIGPARIVSKTAMAEPRFLEVLLCHMGVARRETAAPFTQPA